MGREVRRVPKDWQHPRDRYGDLIPLFDGDHETACQEWLDNCILWAHGNHPAQEDDFNRTIQFYWQYSNCPEVAWDDRGGHMYEKPRTDLTHYQLYENTTEGTPKGPVFETLDEVCEHAAEHATFFGYMYVSVEQWRLTLGAEEERP